MNNYIEKYTLQNKIHLAVIFLIMCLVFSIPFGADYGRKLIVVIAVLWIFAVKKDNLLYLFKHKIFIVLTLYVLMHIIAMLWNENYYDGYRHIKNMLIFFYLPVLIFATIIDNKHIKYIIGAFVFGMFINEIISYLIYFDLYETEYSKIHHYPVGFINHIMYSVLVSFAALLILYQAKFMENKYLKTIYILFFITMTMNLVISSGRTGYVVFFGSLVILLITYYKVTFRNFIELLIFPVVVFFLAYMMNDQVQHRVKASFSAINSIKEKRNYDTSFGARLAFYPMTIDILKQPHNSFIFGAGTGDIESEMNASIDRTKITNSYYRHLHNSYLTAYVNTGVIGLILLILLFYYLWKINIHNKEIEFIKQLIILNIAIASLSDVIVSIKEGMFFFAIFIAIILLKEKIEEKEKCQITKI
jgi:O-antigen ligase